MVATVLTVAYLGLEARPVEVQCQIAAGMPAFIMVGLPDKAVAESRERVRAAIAALGLSLPPKRITINLSPADLPKEGSHYDLPVALALLTAMGLIDAEQLAQFLVVGELGLDGNYKILKIGIGEGLDSFLKINDILLLIESHLNFSFINFKLFSRIVLYRSGFSYCIIASTIDGMSFGMQVRPVSPGTRKSLIPPT